MGDELEALRLEVAQRYGKCLLNLQRYELSLKGFLKAQDVTLTFRGADMSVDDRRALFDGGTLGRLVGQLTSLLLISEEMQAEKEQREASDESTPEQPDGTSTARFQFHIPFSNEAYFELRKDLKSLVRMRNHLVHQFLRRHDLMTLEGCRIALATLDKALGRTRRHIADLRGWMESMMQVRHQAFEYMKSPEVQDLIVHGRIPWQHTKIVDALRHAAVELSVDGWTLLSKAAEWFTTRYPHESPENYTCRSWRQVLHECQFFELRYFETNGKSAPYYREKVAGT